MKENWEQRAEVWHREVAFLSWRYLVLGNSNASTSWRELAFLCWCWACVLLSTRKVHYDTCFLCHPVQLSHHFSQNPQPLVANNGRIQSFLRDLRCSWGLLNGKFIRAMLIEPGAPTRINPSCSNKRDVNTSCRDVRLPSFDWHWNLANYCADKTDDYITTDTENITTSTKVVISAPYSIISRSLGVFTTGIPIEPIYIQAPSGSSNAISDVHTGTICTTGPTRQRTRICPWIEIWNQGKRFASCAGLVAWMTLQCRGGAARITLPSYAANYVLLQTDPTGEWMRANIPQNSEQEVTGLGIKFRQNISVANDALATLMYGKGSGNVRPRAIATAISISHTHIYL